MLLPVQDGYVATEEILTVTFTGDTGITIMYRVGGITSRTATPEQIAYIKKILDGDLKDIQAHLERVQEEGYLYRKHDELMLELDMLDERWKREEARADRQREQKK